MTEKNFDTVLPHVSKYETQIENYLLQPENRSPDEEPIPLLAYRDPCIDVKEPSVSLWDFLDKKDLDQFLLIKKKTEIRKFIASRISVYPKGKARTVFVELMYNVTKFCKNRNFNLEQSGAMLSMFYLTHIFFNSKFDISSEKIYMYFKELALCHSLPFPPKSIKIFSLKETTEIMDQFCRLYLRNLPLIRFLCLPNFAFYMSYELEPEPKKEKGKGKKKK